MEPTDIFELRSLGRAKKAAQETVDHITATFDEVEHRDPGEPEAWENLDLQQRFDDLYTKLLMILKHDQTSTRPRRIKVEHRGKIETFILYFVVDTRDAVQGIEAVWLDGERTVHNEPIARDDLGKIGEDHQSRLEIKLNNLHKSLEAYTAAHVV